MMHFYWAAHVHHALRVSHGVRVALMAATEMSLARLTRVARYCRTGLTVANASSRLPQVRGPVWGNMQRRLCPYAGGAWCQWGSHRCAGSAARDAGGEASALYSTEGVSNERRKE